MATWAELQVVADDLAEAGRELLMNCAPEWGIALLGTIRRDGSPRIGPLCVYLLDGRLYVTVEGHKEDDLSRDPRYSLHSYWGDGQDEFAISGRAGDHAAGQTRERLVELSPRIKHSPVIRELDIAAAYAVTYKNFPTPEMYADIVSWRADGEPRRWQRVDGAPPEDAIEATAQGY